MKHFAILLVLTGLSSQLPAQQLREAPVTPAFTPVTWERLVNAADEPENWLMYSATLDSQRHSRLDLHVDPEGHRLATEDVDIREPEQAALVSLLQIGAYARGVAGHEVPGPLED